MKNSILFLALIFISFLTSLHAQTFVKSDATGANNGSSWTDAYTSLAMAIDSAQAGDQLWVAAGTYRPGTSRFSAFVLNKNLQLYGGFAGTESLLSQRNDTLNQTILSGDLGEDDILNDWDSNKVDNARTIMRLSSVIDTTTIIDGFTITAAYNDSSNNSINAAGIEVKGSPIIRNCRFSHNYSFNSGAALRINGSGANYSRVESCTFIHNKTDMRGAGLALEFLFGGNAQVVGCHFEENEARETGGGAYIFNCDLQMSNCAFFENYSEFLGGGMFVLAYSTNQEVQIEGCLFENNTATLGGGLDIETGGLHFLGKVTDCQFRNNRCQPLWAGYSPSGGGLFVNHFVNSRSCTVVVTACDFENNTARDLGAGFFCEFSGVNGAVIVDSCRFSENTLTGTGFSANSSGGAGLQAYGNNINAYLEVQHSDFISNSGGLFGALYLWTNREGSLKSRINQCSFISNESLENGAGVALNTTSNALSSNHVIENCLFEANHFMDETRQTYGGGMAINMLIDSAQATIRNSHFKNNSNPNGGAALEVHSTSSSPNLSKVQVEGSLFTGHISGRAVLQMSHATQTTLSNLTIADNEITALKATTNAAVKLRNSIIHNRVGAAIQTESNGTVSSLGGNLASDSRASDFLTAQDIVGQDPAFEGQGDHPYQIRFNSPAVDLGTFFQGFDPMSNDMAGNARWQGSKIDAGAYESPFFTSIKDQLDESSSLKMYPVPVVNQATLELDNSWRGQVWLKIYNAAGQLVYSSSLRKNDRQLSWSLDLWMLAAGQYNLLLTDGKQNLSKAFTKVWQ